MDADFTLEECMDYVVDQLTKGDIGMIMFFEAQHPGGWITIKDYEKIAKIIQKRLNNGEKGIV